MKTLKPSKSVALALRKLLLEGAAGTHEEICQTLEKQGFNVNQPKVSRLLHKIGAVKITDQDGQNIYRLPHAQGLMHELNIPTVKFPLAQSIISIDHNTALIVIHTSPGAAALVAREIDLHLSNLNILGSIAGDDTIFIAPKEVKNIKRTIEKISVILQL